MDCPRCNEKMGRSDSNGIARYQCHYCNGTWVGHDAMALLLDREKTALDIDQIIQSPRYAKSNGNRLACPDCTDQNLLRIFVYKVELDICPACHGLFFDEGELKAILPTVHEPQRSSGIREAIVGEGLFWIILGLLTGGS